MPASLGGRHGGHKRLFMGHVLENLVHRFDAPHQVGAAAAAPPCGSKDGGPCGPGNGVLAAGPKWGRRAATGHAHGYAPSRICLRTRVCVLVRQFAMGGLLMGAFVTVYNYIGFRLMLPPFSLSQTLIGAIFVVYLVGIFSSTLFGRLADRHGRGAMLSSATLLALAGLLLTLSDSLPVVVAGIVVFTFGFFAAHAVASGWVGQLAQGYKAQAAALYLLVYYVGASVLGALGGGSWSAAAWVGVTELAGGLLGVALAISVWLNRGVLARGQAATDPR